MTFSRPTKLNLTKVYEEELRDITCNILTLDIPTGWGDFAPSGGLYLWQKKKLEVSVMNNHITFYGFTREQMSLLISYMPDGYFFEKVEDVTELIATHRVCHFINSEGMDTKSRELLDSFYLDVSENVEAQVIWIDSQTKPPVLEGIYYHYDDLLKLLPELKKVLDRAQKHYMIQQMFHGAYAFLPKRGIEEILEDELCIARLNYIKNEEQQIVKRVRREWVSLLETDSVAELAAVYEFSAWLKQNKHPYRLGGTAVSGLIPYLLGIHDVNPLPSPSVLP